MPSAVRNTCYHHSPELSPTAASSTHSRRNSSTAIALGGYHGEDVSSELPVNAVNSSEGLASVLRNPEPVPASTSPAVGPPGMSVQLEEGLDHASSLLNDDQPTAAMHFLASLAKRLPEAQNQYAYHSRYGRALLSHIDDLNAQGRLGQIALTATVIAGHVAISELNAERIGCYVGVCGSYCKFLQLLSEPDNRQRFIAKNGEAVLDECEDGVKHGLAHAILEIRLFVNRLTQCNTNLVSAPAVKLFVEPVDSDEARETLRNFREAQAEPMYDQYTEAGHAVRLKLRQTGEDHTSVWFAWGMRERKRFEAMPEVASALANPDVVARLGRSFR
jgi:hypothetical protein